MPIQPTGAAREVGWIDIYEAYREGLKDLDGFSHLILLYHFHKVDQINLVVTPFLDTQPHGVFATRAPTRPNPIGLSIVKLNSIENGNLHISNVDILDGTPLLDIKPYVPDFENQEDIRTGWLKTTAEEIQSKVSDERFLSDSFKNGGTNPTDPPS